jgi:hypothetical protein
MFFSSKKDTLIHMTSMKLSKREENNKSVNKYETQSFNVIDGSI